jgi:hypothetical protein
MRRTSSLPIFFTAALAACTVAPPSGPSVTALPGPGKSFPQFQQDDDQCRGYAAERTQNAPQDAAAASNNADATAVAGTLIGAAAGAALGSLSGNVGTGAAVGAGAGLLAGASSAGGQAQGAADSLQQQYDAAYEQCMVGNGEALNGPPPVGYDPGPNSADAAIPAAIATGAAAAIILNSHQDDDGGYRPDEHGGYAPDHSGEYRPNAQQAGDRPADHQRPDKTAHVKPETPVVAPAQAAPAATPAVATPAADDATKHKDRKKPSS